MSKLKEILSSVRFWALTIGAVVAILSFYGVIPAEIQKIVLVWLGTVTGIGTLDKVVDKVSQ
ncbi:hypothetical protein N8148_03095 [Gammaproteobacteria bacterium]|nr:hypothetical protein [Gammaproteobacteria bacterium]